MSNSRVFRIAAILLVVLAVIVLIKAVFLAALLLLVAAGLFWMVSRETADSADAERD